MQTEHFHAGRIRVVPSDASPGPAAAVLKRQCMHRMLMADSRNAPNTGRRMPGEHRRRSKGFGRCLHLQPVLVPWLEGAPGFPVHIDSLPQPDERTGTTPAGKHIRRQSLLYVLASEDKSW